MFYLGIDCGGTKTKFSLCDGEGHCVATVNKETCHYLQVSEEVFISRLKEGIADLCLQIGCVKEDIARIFYGCAGYGDVQKDCPIIEEMAQKAFEPIPFEIGNDGVNALAGALAGKDGINIICGTGSIGLGINSGNGKTVSCGGWHHAIGSDEGSGYWLAIELLHEFTRQSDGRDEKTALYQQVIDALQLKEDGEIITRIVEQWQLDRTKVASLSRLLGPLCTVQDPFALQIIKKAAKELFDIIYAIYRKLDFEGDVSVSYTGGVFNIGDPLIQPLSVLLKKHHMILCKPVLQPDEGAMLLALKNSGISIGETIIKNLQKKKPAH